MVPRATPKKFKIGYADKKWKFSSMLGSDVHLEIQKSGFLWSVANDYPKFDAFFCFFKLFVCQPSTVASQNWIIRNNIFVHDCTFQRIQVGHNFFFSISLNFQLLYSGEWPQTSYLKMIDIWTILCYSGAFFCLIEYALVLYLTQNTTGRNATRERQAAGTWQATSLADWQHCVRRRKKPGDYQKIGGGSGAQYDFGPTRGWRFTDQGEKRKHRIGRALRPERQAFPIRRRRTQKWRQIQKRR